MLRIKNPRGETDKSAWTSYSANGNINSKTGIGAYSYGSKPHAVTGVENTGGLISNSTLSTPFNAFNKVDYIADAGSGYRLDFDYGPDRERWKTMLRLNGNTVKTTIFAGDYEQITAGGATQRLYYLDGGAIFVKQDGQADKVYYAGTDHLGSIVRLVDGNGTEVFAATYDAWGKRTVTNNTFAFHRGFTGHEHLPEFDLINMNGRLYDPTVGRFLSCDPYVQAPDFSQNFNRYSYCLNNPLRFTDPSGEFFLWTMINAVKDFYVNTYARSWSEGFNAWSNKDNWHSTTMAWKVDTGWFRGSFWQVASRFTWEFPQSFLGYMTAGSLVTVNAVKSVTYWGGATAVETYSDKWGGFTLGNFITGERGLKADPNNELFQHEYGHYLQSQSFGLFYLQRFAIPSIFDASGNSRHDYHAVEQDANIRAYKYFMKHVKGFNVKDNSGNYSNGRWWETSNPIKNYNWSLSYNNPYNQSALKNGLMGLKWWDYYIGPTIIIPGFINSFNLKQ